MEKVQEKAKEKQEISVRTSVKAIITGFVAYGIICLFLCICFSLFINTLLINNTNIILGITVPVLECFLLYHIIHGICRLSTYDVLKKCKTNPNNIDNISKKMNLFFVVCAILFVVLSIVFLVLKLDTLYSQIKISELQYGQVFSEKFTEKLTNDMLTHYNEQKAYSIISTVIIELGLVVSIFSLIPYQKKMLHTYNTL